MRSPAWALCWQVWGEHRRGLLACAAVGLVLALAARALPLGTELSVGFLVVVVLPTAGVWTFAAYAFSFTAETRLEAPESGFPARAFTLPVPTRALVGWPMLQAAVAAALLWLAWAGLVVGPAGLRMDLGWPAVLAAALMAWLQAICWSPFPVRFLRLLVTVLVLTSLGMSPVVGFAYGLPSAALAGLLAAVTLPAYAVAAAGVGRARRGESREWAWPARLAEAVRALLPRRRAGFASPVAAQAWFEWRQSGAGLPYLTALTLLWLPLLPLAETMLDPVAKSDSSGPAAALVRALTPAGVLLAGLLAVVPSLGAVAGTELGTVSVRGRAPAARPAGCPPFLAARPLTAGQFVAAKLRMAARSALVAWAILASAAVAWMLFTGSYRRLAAAPFWEDYGPAAKAAASAAVVAALVGLTWLQLAGGLWVKLTGRSWVGVALAAALTAAVSAAAGVVHWAVMKNVPGLWEALRAAAPWVAAALLAAKAVLAGWLTRAVLRRGLVRPRTLAAAGAAWLAAAAAYTGLLYGLARVELPMAAAVVLLAVMPLNRLLAAPLALAWNRNR